MIVMVGIKKPVYLDREMLEELFSIHTPHIINFKQLDMDLHKLFRKQWAGCSGLNFLMMEDMENL